MSGVISHPSQEGAPAKAGGVRGARESGRGGSGHALLLLLTLAGCAASGADKLATFRIVGDAIPDPLVATAPDPARGRDIVVGRDGNCLLCHALPESGARFMGNLAPSLSAVGARLSSGQLRLRLVDSMRLDRDTIVPSYFRVDGLSQVAQAFRGKPILTAQQIEDTIAYLVTLR
jgi:sulfur-oxidizing protein SoxX